MQLSTLYQRLDVIVIIANSDQKGKRLDTHTKPARYQVYVLRLWHEQAASSEHPAAWRFVLEEPKTGQRRGFATLEALTAFLEIELQGQEISETKIQRGDTK